MREDLQLRLLAVGRTIDKLDHIRSLHEQDANPRSLTTHLALAAAEALAEVTGYSEDDAVVLRAYEEILAGIEHSPAVTEMHAWCKTASADHKNRAAWVEDHVAAFRSQLLQNQVRVADPGDQILEDVERKCDAIKQYAAKAHEHGDTATVEALKRALDAIINSEHGYTRFTQHLTGIE